MTKFFHLQESLIPGFEQVKAILQRILLLGVTCDVSGESTSFCSKRID